MTFSDLLAAAMQVWYDEDRLAEEAVLNGSTVTICILEQGRQDDESVAYDYLDVALQPTDYVTCTYRTDTLIYGGVTWRYPLIKQVDPAAINVRWIANQSPKIAR